MLKLLSAAVLAVFGFGAQAATFNAVTTFQGTTCDSGIASSSTSTEISCDISGVTDGRAFEDQPFRFEARAIAEAGRLGVDGSLSVGDGSFTDRNTFRGIAQASFVDTLFFGVDSGTALISVDIAGSQNTDTTSNLNWAEVSTFLFAAINGTTVYSNQINQNPVAGAQTATEGSLGTTELSLDFSGGELSLGASLILGLECLSTGGENICTSSASFFDSIRFVGAEILNENGIRIETSVNSSSGFDYLAGLDPHVAPIPLPASMPMLGIALAGFFCFFRRRRSGTLNTCAAIKT